MGGTHHSEYGEEVTLICERALLTLLGDIGPWSKRVYLVGGLAPRYIVGQDPLSTSPHIGTTDVDLVIGLAVDDVPETYRTLHSNLKSSGFIQTGDSFRWRRKVDRVAVLIDLLCETDKVEPGRIFRPREGTGSSIGAVNVPGAQLVTRDFLVHKLEGERLDAGGLSAVEMRVTGLLPFVVLKTLALQERHDNKDAYDLIFTLANHSGGPAGAAAVAAQSSIVGEPQVDGALSLLGARFKTPGHDGPIAYASFLSVPEDSEDPNAFALLCNEAVATVRQFLENFKAIVGGD